ncbi:hypothetical protein BS17DRAFT_780164 [Gyrodon lividus]|nr:hypothetical protein BS17DRAFT_780164 [Gyrodon lividus]
MGNCESVFYPDNANRRNRVQQLTDDCNYIKQQYDATKLKLDQELAPCKEKLDKVLQAFNCSNITELDTLINSSVTGDDLARWNRVTDAYDKSQVVDEVIMGIQGIVAVAGLVFSTVGALAGGIGFFAGLGVTAELELVLAAIEAIYALINGAIQREKMRDAINALVPSRVKAKFVQEQLNELYECVPTIKAVYDAFEKAGYDKDKIMALLKDGHFLDSLQRETKKITYQATGQDMADMDSRRGSWTNEDPDWHSIVTSLDKAYQEKSAHPDITPQDPSPEAKKAAQPWIGPTPPHDGKISMEFVDERTAPVLTGSLHIKLEDFDTDQTARVRINTPDDQKTLVADLDKFTVDMKAGVPDTQATHWVLSFVHPEDAPLFSTAGKDFDSSKRPKKVQAYVRVNMPGLKLEDFPYLTKAGILYGHWDKPASQFVAAYV